MPGGRGDVGEIFRMRGGFGPLASSIRYMDFGELFFRNSLENSWRVLDRLCLVAQEGEMGHLRPVLATRYTPDRGLFGFSRQSLELDFSHSRCVAERVG